MDTTKLVAALDQVIAQERPIEEKIFLRLLKEVWQVDSSVAPYDVWNRMMELNIRYFSTFMDRDEGDEIEEHELIDDWIRCSWELDESAYGREAQSIKALMNEANRIRDTNNDSHQHFLEEKSEVAALDEMIAQDRPIEEKIFLRLLKEVWQVDSTVAPYDVWLHIRVFNVNYFSSFFMDRDEGDEIEESELIADWLHCRKEMQMIPYDPEAQRRMIALIEEANRIRVTAQ